MRKKEIIRGLMNIKERMLDCDGGNYFNKEDWCVIHEAIIELTLHMKEKEKK